MIFEVDDEPMLLDLAHAMLKPAVLATDCAVGGVSGLEIAAPMPSTCLQPEGGAV